MTLCPFSPSGGHPEWVHSTGAEESLERVQAQYGGRRHQLQWNPPGLWQMGQVIQCNMSFPPVLVLPCSGSNGTVTLKLGGLPCMQWWYISWRELGYRRQEDLFIYFAANSSAWWGVIHREIDFLSLVPKCECHSVEQSGSFSMNSCWTFWSYCQGQSIPITTAYVIIEKTENILQPEE